MNKLPPSNYKFALGQTVLAPYGLAEVLMIVGPRSDEPNKENRYSIKYLAAYGSGLQRKPVKEVFEWRDESELQPAKQ
jgi:hypothetical protein